MNVFILCTGRSGSKSLTLACKHITNYTVGHETMAREVGDRRFDYPDNHIEVDNRLSWFLGRLDAIYGDTAFYVHLKRAKEPTVASFLERWDNQGSIIKSYAEGILLQGFNKLTHQQKKNIASDYYETVSQNIKYFLKGKTHQMNMDLENLEHSFSEFFKLINAEGNLENAIKTFQIPTNTSAQAKPDLKSRLKNKLNRLL